MSGVALALAEVYLAGAVLSLAVMARLIHICPQRFVGIAYRRLVWRLCLLMLVWPRTLWRLYGKRMWRTYRGRA